MILETSLASGIRVTAQMQAYDAVCKRLLAEKSILSWILQACVTEFRHTAVSEIAGRCIEEPPQIGAEPVHPDEKPPSRIRGDTTEDSSVTEGVVTYDIRFRAAVPQKDSSLELIVDVEAQDDFYPGYPLLCRGIYYCCRLVSSQYGTEFQHSEYGKIKKVYSIWICQNPPKGQQNTVTLYSLQEKNLAGTVKANLAHYDRIALVFIGLGDAEQTDQPVLRLLDLLLDPEASAEYKKKILEEEFQIPMAEHLEEEVNSMCNLSIGVARKGYQQGMEQGIERGIEQGIGQGMEKEKLSNLRSLMKKLHLTPEAAMDLLDIPVQEQARYAAKLREF